MKTYIVCWACGWQNDRGEVETNSGVYCAYDSLEKARTGLEEYKNLFLEELKENALDNDEYEPDIANFMDALDVEIVGSSEACYFEITYNTWDMRSSLHISIRETEIR